MPEGKHFYEFGPFRLDPAERTLLHAGETVSLTPKTFELLLVLVENRGHLLRKGELMEKVWPNTFVDEANLTQCISALRKALDGRNGEASHIQTVPKGGYRFSVPVVEHTEEEIEAKPPQPHPHPGNTVRYAWGVAALLVILVPGLIWKPLRRHFTSPDVPRIESLAVLPLSNLSHDSDQEYFSDGMTDELITDLAKFTRLRVISHSSVERYKGTNQPASEIARELGVDALVEGTVMRSGDRVRITTRLVDARSDRNLWAESYERDLRDVLALQDEVARQVAIEVGVNVQPAGQAPQPNSRIVEPEAHEAYLRGLFYWNQMDCDGFKKGRNSFLQSAAKDPGFAPTYAGLAQSYFGIAEFGCPGMDDVLPQGKAAALKAIEMDPTLGAPHIWLGDQAFHYELDWVKAAKELQLALALDPNNAICLTAYAEFLISRGRTQQGLAEIARALELDPTSLDTNMSATYLLYLAHQFDQAIDRGRKAVELYPDKPAAYIWLAVTYERKGMNQQAMAAHLKSEATWGATPQHLASMQSAYQKDGMRGYWLFQLAAEKARGGDKNPRQACWMAEIYAHLKENGRALEYLRRALEQPCDEIPMLAVDPLYDDLRGDPGFQALLKQAGL